MERPVIRGCTGVLLCGGKSRRMGFDKAFLQRDGDYLLPALAAVLQANFGQVLAVCDTAEKFAGLTPFAGLPLAEDATPAAGPLGGICTAFENTASPWLFVMACDMPGLDIDILYKLASLLQKFPRPDVALCRHGGRLEPLFAFYHRSCLPVLQKQLKSEDKSPRGAFANLRLEVLELEEAEAARAFANLNTQEELAQWHKTGSEGG